MGTPKTWKNVEREVASRFRTSRNVGSGSLGREDRSRSDTVHPRLYIEVKYGDWKRWFRKELRDTLELAAENALKESKIPVIALKKKRQHGFWVLVHIDDLRKVADEIDG